jgi:outer membrane protein TolC
MDVRVRALAIGLAVAWALNAPAAAQDSKGTTSPGGGAADAPLDLAQVIQVALEHNPALEAARHRVAAARLRPDQERRLPDPMLSAGWNSSGNPLPGAGLGTEPTANIGLMVTQPLPYPGKRDLRAAVAGHEADAEARQLDALEREVASRVKQAYYRLALATGATDILERNQAVLETLLRVTEERYAVGRAMQADVFRAQAELTALELKLERVRHDRIAREAELNALMDRHADAPVGRPAPLGLPDFTLTLDQLLRSSVRSPLLARGE